MKMMWRIEMFGGLALKSADASAPEITRFRTRKAAALLARLALEQKPLAREVLVDALWPEATIEGGRNSLRVALASLRRQLEPASTPPNSVLHADRATIALEPLLVTSDVREFRFQLRAAHHVAQPEQRALHLERACQIYRPPLLPGFYEDWVEEHGQQLEALFDWAQDELQALRQKRSHQPPRPLLTQPAPSSGSAHNGATSAQPALEAEEDMVLGARHGAATESASSEGLLEAPLPPRLRRFFGRADEMRALLGLLRDGERIVTLHGMGCCGKTRLGSRASRISTSKTQISTSSASSTRPRCCVAAFNCASPLGTGASCCPCSRLSPARLCARPSSQAGPQVLAAPQTSHRTKKRPLKFLLGRRRERWEPPRPGVRRWKSRACPLFSGAGSAPASECGAPWEIKPSRQSSRLDARCRSKTPRANC